MVTIGDSLWYSIAHKSHSDGENGMVQFCTKTNKIIQIVEYPHNDTIKPCRQFCCKHKEKIYLIDGEHGEIILFDPSTKEFTKQTVIPIIGQYPSAVVIFDCIHIFGGAENEKHLIYDIPNDKVTIKDDKGADNIMTGECLLRYKNKIIRCGGADWTKQQRVDTFMISSEIKEDMDEDIEWKQVSKCKLKQPLHGCGYVLYGHYMITVGGNPSPGEFVDTVYVLDLDDDIGWIEVKHIKCPIQSKYLAVLSDNNYLHIWTEINENVWQDSKRGHYSIHVSTILGSNFECIKR